MYLCNQFRIHMKKLIKKAGLLSFTMIFWVATNAQCAMCKAVVESNTGEGEEVVKGINSGILYLMGIPYLLLMGVGYFVFRHIKKSNNTAS